MIGTIHIQPMQWTALPDLEEVPPLGAGDTACLEELRAVLSRHGKLARFAIHLAHRHFALAPGEVLIERPDPDGRTQHVTVGRLEDEPAARPTTWIFDENAELRLSESVYCICVSSSPLAQGACSQHGSSPSPGRAAVIDGAVRQRHIGEENAKHEQGFPVAGHVPGERHRRRSPSQ